MAENKRITLVTGASRGIGREIARQLAVEKGHHVICVARSKEALEALDDDISQAGGSATLVPFDLKDDEGFARLGEAIFERWGRLDGLVGNAAILGPTGPLPTIMPNQWEEAMMVNVTANMRLIQAFHGLLKQSNSGRAVFITSGAVRSQRAFLSSYVATKAALEGMIMSYAKEVEASDLKVNLYDPGVTRTAMRAQYMPGEDQSMLPPVADVAAQVLPLLEPSFNQNGTRLQFSL